MKTCLVVGRTNVGKTLFFLNFAEYLGLKRLDISYQLPDGTTRQGKFDPSRARQELSGLGVHKTRALQSLELSLPQGKGMRQFRLTDSTGLVDGIHPDKRLREAMAQTLAEMHEADCILHMVDLAEISRAETASALRDLDRQIAEYGQAKRGYALLANKMDAADVKRGLLFLHQELPGQEIIPISALYRQGFREVKEYVWRMV